MYTSLQKSLLQLMQKGHYTPTTLKGLASELGLKSTEHRKLSVILKELCGDGIIVKVKRDRFCLPKDANLISGIISFRQSGAAQVKVDRIDPKGRIATYTIRAEDTGLALHGDHVLCRCRSPERSQKSLHQKSRMRAGDRTAAPLARVIRILQRSSDTVVGTLQRDKTCYYVIPDDPRFLYDILVPPPARASIKPKPRVNQKVVVRLYEWTQRHLNPQGEIVEILGETHQPDAELRALLHKHRLDPEFPDAVNREAKALPQRVSARDVKGRLDLRGLPTLTVDPDDAKDFDDALSVQYIPQGDVLVGIHIADVSAYVRPGSSLDKEAQARGNSTYLPGQVIPMLPSALSNGLCSLVEGEDRLTKSVMLVFSRRGRLKETVFANTIIRSNKRLNYREAYALLFEDDLKKIRSIPLPPKHHTAATGRSLKKLSDRELGDLQGILRQLWSYASQMRKQRMRKGSLDLDIPEIKIRVDRKGAAERIEKSINDESHQLIEEFMLTANEVVARHMMKAQLPCLYRVHEKPDPEKLQELHDYLQTFGIEAGDLTHHKSMVSLLAQIKTHPQGHLLKIAVLRSLKQAGYRPDSEGHYGLQKRHYTHFTSPIRRYSDLIVHRVFDRFLKQTNLDTAPKTAPFKYSYEKLASLGDHLNITERNSIDAEREAVKVKLLECFSNELDRRQKTSFAAIITDLRNYGMFIELTDSAAFGFVRVSSLEDDLYCLSPDGTQLVGRRRRRKFTIGQTVHVVIERVDRYKREMDFRIQSSPSHPASVK